MGQGCPAWWPPGAQGWPGPSWSLRGTFWSSTNPAAPGCAPKVSQKMGNFCLQILNYFNFSWLGLGRGGSGRFSWLWWLFQNLWLTPVNSRRVWNVLWENPGNSGFIPCPHPSLGSVGGILGLFDSSQTLQNPSQNPRTKQKIPSEEKRADDAILAFFLKNPPQNTFFFLKPSQNFSVLILCGALPTLYPQKMS